MSPEKLTYMANQIARFFETRPEPAARAGIAAHINDFWEPRMRAQLFEIAALGETDLHPLVRAAIPEIRRPATAGA